MLPHLIEGRMRVGKTMRQALQQDFDDRMTNWYRLNGIRSHLSWDQQTIMPEKAARGRGQTLSWLAGLAHSHITDDKLGEVVSLLEAELSLLDEDDACNVRRMRREIDMATKLPVKLVEEMASAVSQARQIWQEARAAGDFAMFAPELQKIIDLTKAKMQYLGGDSANYNVLLDEYEIGMTMADYDPLFAGLRERLVPLLEKIMQAQRDKPELSLPEGMQFTTAEQDSFCRFVSARMGFDFAAGRLDTTTHPFCSGLAVGDTRITTRYDESDPFSCLYAVMHESGHGLYEQGLPDQHGLSPRGQAISLGIHESQSRLWENQIGRTTAFWQAVLDTFRQKFPELPPDLGAEEMNRIANAVKPSFIRVEADEITYNLHIMMRYEIEKKIFEEDLPVAEIPEVWNTMFAEWFGIEVPDDSMGCLQDVHWSYGAFGYFPTYTLGNLYAAQLSAKMVDDLGDLDEIIRSGDWSPILAWLREKIYSHGMLYDPSELIERATGQPPSPEPFLDYVEKKYSRIYEL
jgi:carboxypeptidase Taq